MWCRRHQLQRGQTLPPLRSQRLPPPRSLRLPPLHSLRLPLPPPRSLRLPPPRSLHMPPPHSLRLALPPPCSLHLSLPRSLRHPPPPSNLRSRHRWIPRGFHPHILLLRSHRRCHRLHRMLPRRTLSHGRLASQSDANAMRSGKRSVLLHQLGLARQLRRSQRYQQRRMCELQKLVSRCHAMPQQPQGLLLATMDCAVAQLPQHECGRPFNEEVWSWFPRSRN